MLLGGRSAGIQENPRPATREKVDFDGNSWQNAVRVFKRLAEPNYTKTQTNIDRGFESSSFLTFAVAFTGRALPSVC